MTDVFDLFITCDVSARDRLALAGALFEKATEDCLHRPSCEQSGICGYQPCSREISVPVVRCCTESSILEKVTLPIATALYTGMVHDTGVFQVFIYFTGDHAHCR